LPTYEYECTHCGYLFEKFQQITEQPIEKCPKCNKQVKRLIGSGSGIIFKGKGFYATDYRKKTPSQSKPEAPKDINCPKAKEGCTGCQEK